MGSASFKQVALLCCLVISSSVLVHSVSAQTCDSVTFSKNRLYGSCNSLPQLQASLHWNYIQSNSTVELAFRAPQASTGWIAWALNPTGSGMPGAQALVALIDSNGAVRSYTTPLADKSPPMTPANLSYPVTDLSGEFDSSSNVMTIFATITLPGGGGQTTFNHIWQSSSQVTNGVPSGHPFSGANVQSLGSIDFQSGTASAGGNSLLHRRNTHGLLNAVSWGILMPIGIIIARYMKVFKSADPAWFYLHVTCQCSAYIIGVAGWGTGLKLGSDSKGVEQTVHRNIGIALFCFATLQVFALLLRPDKDHKYRPYWKAYHQLVGYSIIILTIINIFKGFDILNPADKWKNAYIGIISTLGGIALILEISTWIIVLRRKSNGSAKSHRGANGYDGRQAQGA